MEVRESISECLEQIRIQEEMKREELLAEIERGYGRNYLDD